MKTMLTIVTMSLTNPTEQTIIIMMLKLNENDVEDEVEVEQEVDEKIKNDNVNDAVMSTSCPVST